MRKVVLLGATGNIGGQTLDIIENDTENFELTGVSVGKRVYKLPTIINDFPSIRHVCVQKYEDYSMLRRIYTNIIWHYGDEGIQELIKECESDMVVNALVGFVGFLPSVAALREDKILCLANKESLVVGGEFINKLLDEGHGKIYPIDSEHVAIAKCLNYFDDLNNVDKILLTASGGSFRDYKRSDLKNVSVARALNHPTWKMGKKITIDSATMMNKGFELIEAYYLFGVPLDDIEVVIHQESYIHSAIQLKNGLIVAEVNKPDMHGPIKYALYESDIDYKLEVSRSLKGLGEQFHFKKFDQERYPAVGLAIRALKTGGIMPAVLNGANEQAVYLFLDEKIGFLDIEEITRLALDNISNIINPTLSDYIEADRKAREFVLNKAKELNS